MWIFSGPQSKGVNLKYAKKIDNNQQSIVRSLRSIPGVSVELDHDDILVGRLGKTYWFEIKNPSKVSKKTGDILESAIKPSQKRIRSTFTGHYSIVSSLDQILIEIGIRI